MAGGAKRAAPPARAAKPEGATAAGGGAAAASGEQQRQLALEVTELKMSVENLERERDFYYSKLREVEVLCQAHEAEQVPLPSLSRCLTAPPLLSLSSVLCPSSHPVSRSTPCSSFPLTLSPPLTPTLPPSRACACGAGALPLVRARDPVQDGRRGRVRDARRRRDRRRRVDFARGAVGRLAATARDRHRRQPLGMWMCVRV